MKAFIVVFAALALAACGSDEPTPQYRPGEDPATLERNKAAYQAKLAELQKIEYPTCAEVWDGDRVSTCGKEVFLKALGECRSRATANMGGAPALINEYTGDSWQMRAGSLAVRSDDERADDLRREDTPYIEFYSYARGNGTDDIENVSCTVDDGLRLTNYS